MTFDSLCRRASNCATLCSRSVIFMRAHSVLCTLTLTLWVRTEWVRTKSEWVSSSPTKEAKRSVPALRFASFVGGPRSYPLGTEREDCARFPTLWVQQQKRTGALLLLLLCHFFLAKTDKTPYQELTIESRLDKFFLFNS